MDHAAVLAMFDDQMRRNVRADGGPAVRVERIGDLVRQTGAGWNAIVWSDLGPDTADAAITGEVKHFTALAQEVEWKLYGHDMPKDLGLRLFEAGFVPGPEETLMVAEVRDLPTTIELPEGVALHVVTDAAGVDLVAEVHERAFSTDDAPTREQLLALLSESPDTVVVVVATVGDLPVCAARLELPPGVQFASLWGGGTVPEWRGRGIYRAVVAFRARVAAERGYRYLQVDASSQSRPILQRLGFVPLSTTTPYVHQP